MPDGLNLFVFHSPLLWREEAAIHLIPTYNGGAIHANAKDIIPTIRPTTI